MLLSECHICFDMPCWHLPPLLSGQDADAPNQRGGCWRRLWRLHSAGNSDKNTQRQKGPGATWHYRPPDPMLCWPRRHSVTPTKSANNDMAVVWWHLNLLQAERQWELCLKQLVSRNIHKTDSWKTQINSDNEGFLLPLLQRCITRKKSPQSSCSEKHLLEMI